MSIDTPIQDVAHGDHGDHGDHGGHGGDEGHHDAPEVVDHRERVGVWLFIVADAIIVVALLFTYLYLRGVDTGHHWMNLLGYKGSLHTYSAWENLYNNGTLKPPSLVYTGPLSAGLQWLVAALSVVCAGLLWIGERGLRMTKNAKSYSGIALVATIVALVAVLFTAIQLHDIPQVFVGANDSITMSYTAYDSTMMVIFASTLFHLVVLAFIGLGLCIRSARGAITGTKWFQARLARMFFVWVALATVFTTLITTMINTIH